MQLVADRPPTGPSLACCADRDIGPSGSPFGGGTFTGGLAGGSNAINFGSSKWSVELDTGDNDPLFKYNGTTVFKLASNGAAVLCRQRHSLRITIMAIAASGAVSLADLRTEFVGGTQCHLTGDLYRGGSHIRSLAANNTATNLAASVPTSGAIDFN